MIDWDHIDTAFLDMDGTLLDLHYDNFFWETAMPREYARANKLSERQALDALRPIFNARRGTLEWYSIPLWSETTGLDIISLKRDFSDRIAIRQDVPEFLAAVRAKNVRCVLATNADTHCLGLKMELTGLDQHLDRCISSAELGVAKEEVAFWAKMQGLEPFDPARTIFIDDTTGILDTAQTFGIQHTVAIEQPDSCRERHIETHHRVIREFTEIMPA